MQNNGFKLKLIIDSTVIYMIQSHFLGTSFEENKTVTSICVSTETFTIGVPPLFTKKKGMNFVLLVIKKTHLSLSSLANTNNNPGKRSEPFLKKNMDLNLKCKKKKEKKSVIKLKKTIIMTYLNSKASIF